MNVSLTLVQTFYHVAQLGSYSAAARSLGISYQSAANHIRRLEQVAKGKLVKSSKGGKQINLTSRGKNLYKLLHPELDSMLNRLSLIINEDRPILRVGLPQSMFYYLFPNILEQFRIRRPTVEIQAFERDTLLSELVKDGSLDICISERYFGDPDVPQHQVGEYGLSLIYPSEWGKVPETSELADWLKGRPFVTYEPGQTLRNASICYLKGISVEPNILTSTSGGSSVKKCVENGLGYSIIPNWCIGSKETVIEAIRLPDIPNVKIYFGHARFLSDNIYLKDLFEICSKSFDANFPSETLTTETTVVETKDIDT